MAAPDQASPGPTAAWAGCLCLAAVVVLPLLTFPLSWLPASTASRSFSFPWTPLVAAVALVAGAGHLHRRGVLGCQPMVGWCLLALLASVLVSVRLSRYPAASLGILPAVAANLVLFHTASCLTETSRRRLAWVWLGACLLVAANGLVRLAFEPEFHSSIGNRNLLGAYLATGVCLGIGLTWYRANTATRQWAGGSASAVLLVALWFCGSRGAWLGLVAGLAALGALSLPRRRLMLSLLSVVVLALGLGLLPAVRRSLVHQWQTDVRPPIWQATLRLTADRLPWGHGLGSYLLAYPQYRLPSYFSRPKAAPVTNHAHNQVLETAAEQGLFGAGVLVAVWALALRRGWKDGRMEEWRNEKQPPPAASAADLSGIPALRQPSNHPAHPGIRSSTLPSFHSSSLLFLAPAVVLVVHGLVDIGLAVPPLGPLSWLLLGLLLGGSGHAGAGGGAWAVGGRATRGLITAALLGIGCWLVVAGVVRPVRAELAERRAERAAARGEWAAALFAAQESLALDPMRLPLRYRLARLLAGMGTLAARHEAIKLLRALNELAPHYAQLDFNLGLLYAAEGRYDEALPHLEYAARSNPRDAEVRQALDQVRAAQRAATDSP